MIWPTKRRGRQIPERRSAKNLCLGEPVTILVYPAEERPIYSHCLFCQTSLGSNEVVEALPIGHRLAFDQAQGRLWVVCRDCERWNLTPFDERWEAIETCERRYRDTRRRFATDNIGLARLPSGLELVRIGEPLRPEFAAWRYGDQFGKRHRRVLIATAGLTGLVLGMQWAPLLGVSLLGSLSQLAGQVYLARRTVARVRGDNGDVLQLNLGRAAATTARVEEGGQLTLTIARMRGWWGRTPTGRSDVLRGDAANEGLRGVLRALNYDGGSKQAVRAAAGLVDGSNPDNRLFSLLPKAGPNVRFLAGLRLGHQSKELRLALEMAANEDAERVWLAGELLDLERAWREAEEIAQIADGLGLPGSLDDQVEQLKRARSGDG